MFVDQIRIRAKAGDGGDGAVSFRREKFVPNGGPDGGDGGDGGSVILEADIHTDNLVALYYEPIIRAKSGAKGMGKQKHGKSAPDTVIKVPVGTIVYSIPETLGPNRPPDADAAADGAATGRKRALPSTTQLDPIVDLVEAGQCFVLCEGGKGGRGNVHFKSSRNRVPRQYKPGGEGGEGTFLLELRQIADAGLVGYPNAGKSTLLGAMSAAHPKVAPYPFTTLHPVIGVVDFDGYSRATIADIPGLIEGAHMNAGLGHDFLRHILRCRLLLFVLDMAGSEGRDPAEDLSKLRTELRLYDSRLAAREWLVVANKMDLPGADANLRAFKRRHPKRLVVPVSAANKEGLDKLREVLAPQIAHLA